MCPLDRSAVGFIVTHRLADVEAETLIYRGRGTLLRCRLRTPLMLTVCGASSATAEAAADQAISAVTGCRGGGGGGFLNVSEEGVLRRHLLTDNRQLTSLTPFCSVSSPSMSGDDQGFRPFVAVPAVFGVGGISGCDVWDLFVQQGRVQRVWEDLWSSVMLHAATSRNETAVTTRGTQGKRAWLWCWLQG